MRYYTPPQIARMYGVKSDKVLRWIRKGDLRAVNVGDGTRARFRVSPDALIEFENLRSGAEQPKPTRRRKEKDVAVIEFF